MRDGHVRITRGQLGIADVDPDRTARGRVAGISLEHTVVTDENDRPSFAMTMRSPFAITERPFTVVGASVVVEDGTIRVALTL